MVRVLFYTGSALLAVSAALLYLPTYFSLIIAVLLVALLILSFIFGKRMKISGIKTLLSITLVFTLYGIYLSLATLPSTQNLAGYNAEVIATICERPIRYETYSVYTLETEKIQIKYNDGQKKLDNVPSDIKIELTDVNKINADTFDKIKVNVSFNELGKHQNSYLSNKIYAKGQINSLVCNFGENRPFYAFFYDLRDNLNHLLYKNVNYEDATVVSAILLGDRSSLDPQFQSEAKAAGISHVLVVSGLHLGIIYMVLDKLLRLFKLSNRFTNIIMLGAIFALMAICGFTPSILRAGLTYILLCIGKLMFKRADSLNSLGAAAILILFSNPFAFGNIALLLSLFSTFGLLVLCPIFYKYICLFLNRYYNVGYVTKTITLSLCQTLSATLTTMPIILVVFGYISLISPITNLLISFAVTALTVTSLFAIIFMCLPGVLFAISAVFIVVLCLLVRYIVAITHLCASFDFATISAGPEILIPIVVIAIIVIILVALHKRKPDKRVKLIFYSYSAILIAASIIVAICLYTPKPTLTISVPKLNNGSSLIIKHKDYTTIIGAGDTEDDAYKILNTLNGGSFAEIDYLILPSLDKTLCGGAAELIYTAQIDNIVHPTEGEYSDKINYISDDRFTKYNKISKIKNDDFEVIVLNGIGAVYISDECTVITYLSGDINFLLKYVKSESPILFCVNNLPNISIKKKFEKVIISGTKENRNAMKKQLASNNIAFETIEDNAISIGIN